MRWGSVTISLWLLGGCAGTPPKATLVQTPSAENKVDINDTAAVTVSSTSGLTMLEMEKQRLAEVIKQKIDTKKWLNGNGGDASNYDVAVTVTRYAKGNAFARAMLAGLGQIHLDAMVSLFRAGTQDKVGEFSVSKTFAWGGLYGGVTRIEDIEPAFAEGVAAALTGQQESAAK